MAMPGDIEHFMGNHSVLSVEKVPWWDEDRRKELIAELLVAAKFDELLAAMDPRPDLDTTASEASKAA